MANATAAGLSYRERTPAGAPPLGTVLCLHGYPESSYMWEHVLAAASDAGWRALAPDLAGYGDSPLGRGDGSWEHQLACVSEFQHELELGTVVLVVHDWGGLIGLRWACENPGLVRALVISDTGFFPDGRWHGLADAMRTAGQGETLIDQMTRAGFAAMLAGVSQIGDDAVGEYWKAFGDPARRRAQLALYRSGDFDKLEPYAGMLAGLGVPALLLWGGDDPFAPLAGAQRLLGELPGARLEVVEGTGHFVYDDAPQQTCAAIVSFLGQL